MRNRRFRVGTNQPRPHTQTVSTGPVVRWVSQVLRVRGTKSRRKGGASTVLRRTTCPRPLLEREGVMPARARRRVGRMPEPPVTGGTLGHDRRDADVFRDRVSKLSRPSGRVAPNPRARRLAASVGQTGCSTRVAIAVNSSCQFVRTGGNSYCTRSASATASPFSSALRSALSCATRS